MWFSENDFWVLLSFPKLKGNEIVQREIQVIINNQDRIIQLKLEKAKLNKYKFWLFMGE